VGQESAQGEQYAVVRRKESRWRKRMCRYTGPCQQEKARPTNCFGRAQVGGGNNPGVCKPTKPDLVLA
jgi:hypothetical protein